MVAYLKIILRNFLFRKKRTFLTVLGITIGTTLILTLVLLGRGLEGALTSQLEAFGSDLIYIMPGKEDNPLAGILSGGQIPDRDLRTIQETKGVDLVMGNSVKDFRVEFEGEEKVVNVSGAPWEEARVIFGKAQGFELADGDWPARDDLNQAVLGDLVAKDRFSKPVRPGDELVIKGKRFLVAGVFKSLGNSDDDSRIYMSLDRFRAISGDRSGVNFVMAKAEPGTDVKRVADDIKYYLERQRNSGDVVVFTSDSAIRVIGDVLGVVQLVLGAFAAVALIVGGINIMNTMFTSVLERTREVGVMKALGSTDRSILLLFLTEAGLLGLIGGLFGIGISYGFGKVIEFGAAQQNFGILKVAFPLPVVVFSLVFTFVVGAIFGVIPAVRASRLRPTEALRYE